METAIVTGSDSGIGKATAIALARRGFNIGLTVHADERGVQATAREVEQHGVRAVVARLDLGDGDSVQPVIEQLIDSFDGPLRVFVNNAGTGNSTPFLEESLEMFRHVLEVDLVGAFLAAQVAARRMVEQGDGGVIVNVTSIHEHVPLKGSSAYCAAKGGLGLLTKVMALELAEHGIRVNAVAPGEIATPMTGNEDEDPHARDRPSIPAGRPGDAREIAELIAFLCTDSAAYATGSSFVMDGGLTLTAANQDVPS
ncbi:MAG: short-chain dehydrogenase/reductase [Thermoleophilia bacterium]|nr:short-chain dehydrogenase/reductase [Thermoleophilia bacterium]